MQRRQVLFGVLGLALAASAARAAAPGEVTLFGQKYKVTIQSRAQTYKNGVKITLPGTDNKKAGLDFVEGADPSADRLWVACPTDGGEVADQLYMLMGADPTTGVFDASHAAAIQAFGGAVNDDDGGRMFAVVYLRDPLDSVPVGQDRNLAVFQLSGPDSLILYDARNIAKGNYVDDMVFGRTDEAESTATDFRHDQDSNPKYHLDVDPNMAYGGSSVGFLARGPNGAFVMGSPNSDGSGLEIGVMDPKMDLFFPVKTDLAMATASATIKLDQPDQGSALVRMVDNGGTNDEYWLLTSVGSPSGDTNDANGSEPLYRLKITFPADLKNGKANSIKVEPIAKEDVFLLKLHASDGGIFGLTAGRKRGTNGARDLYMTDWQGNLITLTAE